MTPFLGQRVRKAKGFQFPGVIVAMFTTTAGKHRVVVEAVHPEFAGMLHIYDPEQLIERHDITLCEECGNRIRPEYNGRNDSHQERCSRYLPF